MTLRVGVRGRCLWQVFSAMNRNVGKLVGGAVYVHRSAVGLLPSKHAATVEKAEALLEGPMWNVVRIAKGSVSLLLYESFDDAAFPALLASSKVDLVSGDVSHTNYLNRTNPPILHRKELLLPPDDPRLPAFRALTCAAEEHGLFAELEQDRHPKGLGGADRRRGPGLARPSPNPSRRGACASRPAQDRYRAPRSLAADAAYDEIWRCWSRSHGF